ncbi:MAG: hypothetical protein ACOCXJ_00075 [Planctomycetota bacterium]
MGYVREPDTDRILGVTICASQAGELIAPFVLAMRTGIGLKRVLGTVFAYPTLAEADRHVAGAWRQRHQPERMLRVLARVHRWQRHRWGRRGMAMAAVLLPILLILAAWFLWRWWQ